MITPIIGLDLGQAQDYSAAASLEPTIWHPGEARWVIPSMLTDVDRSVIERYGRDGQQAAPGKPLLYCRHLQRWPLGTRYPKIVDDVVRLRRSGLAAATLLVDAGGVGAAVTDMFFGRVRTMLPIAITGGNLVGSSGGHWTVPKKDIIGATQVLLQSGRLKIAGSIPEATTLVKDLQSYRVRVTEHANETFDARSGEHDDLVLALGLACWWYLFNVPA